MNKFLKSSVTVRGTKSMLMIASLLLLLVVGCIVNMELSTWLTIVGCKIAVLVALPEGQKRSGKSGTLVWLRNDIMRTWAIPRVVRNGYTTAVRATLAGFSTAWRGLTQSEQNGWLKGTRSVTNRLGKSVNISGKTLFVQLNANLATINVAPYNDYLAPGVVVVPTYAAKPTAAVTGTRIVINLDNSDADYGIVIEATAPLSFGINSPKNSEFRVIEVNEDSAAYQASLTRDVDNWNAYVVKFGTPAAGDAIWVRAKYINNTTGDASITSEAFKVIVAA